MVFSTCYRDVLSGTPRRKTAIKKIKLPDQIRYILKHIYKGELTCRVLKKLAILITLGIRIPDWYFFFNANTQEDVDRYILLGFKIGVVC